LLDTYFATRKVDAFIKEAQNLKSMGDPARRYWDRVQIMGYELAPDNALFSDAKDSGLRAADLEIAKPQEADFDLGAGEEDDTNFSSTDFNLGDEVGDLDLGIGEAGVLESTQELSSVGKADRDDGDLPELPDDIGDELEFSMDDDEVDADKPKADADELELPDDLMDDLALDDDLDFDDAVQITPPDEDDAAMAKTAIITPNYQETEIFRPVDAVKNDGSAATDDDEDLSGIDLGMEDTAMKTGDQYIEETGELLIDMGEDDAEDISIIDFGGDDFEDTGEIASVSLDDDDEGSGETASVSLDDDDDFVLDDDEGEEIRTGTFAPGDFDEPTAAISSLADIDDMDDLMLPDDVDEVSTKLDLARAFIDMGDTEGARGSLEEVMSEGNAEQKAEAKSLLAQI